MAAVAAIGARKTMVDWPAVLNGAGVTAIIAAVTGGVIRRYEKRSDIQQTKLVQDVAWTTKLLEDGEKMRGELRERVAVLEHRAEESAEKVYQLEAELLAEKATVSKLIAENEMLRRVNEDLRAENARLVGELQEEQARNHEWKQKILALQEQIDSMKGD